MKQSPIQNLHIFHRYPIRLSRVCAHAYLPFLCVKSAPLLSCPETIKHLHQKSTFTIIQLPFVFDFEVIINVTYRPIVEDFYKSYTVPTEQLNITTADD